MAMNRETEADAAAQGAARPRRRAPKRAPARPAPPPHRSPRRSAPRPRQFVREVRGELRKVAWPTRAEVINYSIIVLVTLVVLTAFIVGLDYGFSEVRPLALRRMTHDATSTPTDTAEHRRPPTRRRADADAADADGAEPRPTRRRRREAVAEADADEAVDAEDAATDEVDVDDELLDEEAAARAGREPVRPARPLVRGAHAVGLREEGQAEPRGPHLLHEHGGPHPRGRHPDGGRHRVQERQEGRRPEEDVPRLPARALRPRRRLAGT